MVLLNYKVGSINLAGYALLLGLTGPVTDWQLGSTIW